VSAVAIGGIAAVACALGWATLDVLRKQLVERLDPLPLLAWLTALQLPVLLVWALVVGEWRIAPAYVPWGLGSIALNVGANLLYLVAIRRGAFSQAIPLLAFVPVFATLLGVPLLGQLPNALQWLGIAAVVVGAVLLHGGLAGLRRLGIVLVREPSAAMMLLVALGWAGTIVLDRRAIEHTSLPVHALLLDAGIVVAVLVALAWRGQLGMLAQARAAPWRLLAAATVAGAALGLQLRAIQDIIIAVIEAIKRSTGVVAAVVFGRLVFGESIGPTKLFACALMGVGTVLVLDLI